MGDKQTNNKKLTKEEFEKLLPDLRVDLINAQYDLQRADFSVLLVIAGDDRLGCSDLIDRLHEWLDARYIDTRVFLKRTEEESWRPRFWRYWRAIPPKGRIGIHLGAWPAHALYERVMGIISKKAFQKRIEHIRSFEKALTDDGMLILKFWIHLPKKTLKQRYKKLKEDKNKSWRVEKLDDQIVENFDTLVEVGEELLAETSLPSAPWRLIDGEDERGRDLSVAQIILEALTKRLKGEQRSTELPVDAGRTAGIPDKLSEVDLSATLEYDEYKKKLQSLQERIGYLTRKAREQGVTSVLCFEGWDAAGKGGVIRRITKPMMARDYRVIPIAAPTDEELARHYLWRFWRQLPRTGRMIIFDRSWYGRVLVERVEGFAEEVAWRRAYEEINDFEEQLVNHGTVYLKFWLHLDQEEQLRRFQAREKTSYKKYKITEEDYRNRSQWEDYTDAVNEMVAYTSRKKTPWHLVPANNKRFARVQVLERLSEALEKRLS